MIWLDIALALLSFALGVYAGWVAWGWGSAEEPKGTPETPAAVPAAVPDKVAAETIREVPARVRAPEPWKVEFLSGSGRRVLGREKMTGRRAPQIRYVGLDGLTGVFVADHQRTTDGVWEYRRVGVEK